MSASALAVSGGIQYSDGQIPGLMGETGAFVASLRGLAIEANLTNYSVQVSLRLHFVNELGDVPVTFLFPVHHSVVVVELETIIDEKRKITHVREVDSELSSPLTLPQETFISHQSGDYRFIRVGLGKLLSQQSAVVRINFISELKAQIGRDDTLLFSLPSLYFPFDLPKACSGDKLLGLKVIVNAEMQWGIHSVESLNGHAIKTSREKDIENIVVTSVPHQDFENLIGKDFLLAIRLKNPTLPIFTIESAIKTEGSNESGLDDVDELHGNDRTIGVLSLFPPLSELSPVEIIFFIDRSQSMKWFNRTYTAERILSLALELLPASAYFQVVAFGGNHKFMFSKGSVPATSKNKVKALKALSALQPSYCGTILHSPLQEVLSKSPVEGCLRSVFILTDGDLTNVDLRQVFPLLRNHVNETRCFVFGIVPGICIPALLALARSGRGKYEAIRTHRDFGENFNEAKEIIQLQLQRAAQRPMFHINVDWQINGARATTPTMLHVPRRLPPIYGGEPYLIYAIWPKPHRKRDTGPVTHVRVTAKRKDKEETEWGLAITDDMRSNKGGKLIHMLAIKRLIEEVRDWEGPLGVVVDQPRAIMSSGQSTEEEKDQKEVKKQARVSKGEIIRMAMKISIAAPYINTCLVLEDIDTGIGMVITVFDPLHLPKIKKDAMKVTSKPTMLSQLRSSNSPNVATGLKQPPSKRDPKGLRSDALRMHTKMTGEWSGRNEGTVIKKVDKDAPGVRLIMEEIEGAILFIAVAEIKKQIGNPDATHLSAAHATLARRICKNLLQDVLSKLEFEAIAEGDEPLDKKNVRRATVGLDTIQAVVAREVEILLARVGKHNAPLENPPSQLCYHIVACTETGLRAMNEDTFVVLENLDKLLGVEEGHDWVYVGVFDGHLGRDAADYSAFYLHLHTFRELAKTKSDFHSALMRGFKKTDVMFNERATRCGSKWGSTAMALLFNVKNGSVIVANCGDAKAILGSRSDKVTGIAENDAKIICHIQHPDRPDEKIRIEQAGGKVVWFGTFRVNGQIAVSRSIGDPTLANLVIAEPEFKEAKIDTNEHGFILLATDGLWDAIKEEDVVAQMVRDIAKKKGRAAVPKALCDEALKRGSSDNITIVIIFLGEPEEVVGDNASSLVASAGSNENLDPIAAVAAAAAERRKKAAAAIAAAADMKKVSPSRSPNSSSEAIDMKKPFLKKSPHSSSERIDMKKVSPRRSPYSSSENCKIKPKKEKKEKKKKLKNKKQSEELSPRSNSTDPESDQMLSPKKERKGKGKKDKDKEGKKEKRKGKEKEKEKKKSFSPPEKRKTKKKKEKE